MQLSLRLDQSGLEPTCQKIYGRKWLRPPDIFSTERPQRYWTGNRPLRPSSPIKVYLILYRALPTLRYMAVGPILSSRRSRRSKNSNRGPRSDISLDINQLIFSGYRSRKNIEQSAQGTLRSTNQENIIRTT
jgi:hypothetical protein